MKVKLTVSNIVQRLLENSQITAEEASVLLKAELNNLYCPFLPAAPYNPPFQPYCASDPNYPYSTRTWVTNNSKIINDKQPLGDNNTDK